MRILAALLFILAGCATTPQVKDSWKDPAFSGPALKKVMVFGVSKSDSNRRVFEDGFSKALQAAGTGASPGYAVMPEIGAASNERVAAAIRQVGSDGILVVHVLRVKQNVQVTPSYAGPGFYGRGYYGYYRGGFATAPDVDVYEVLTIEGTLWNVATDKPVWSGTMELTEPRSVAAATETLAKGLITKMKADGVI